MNYSANRVIIRPLTLEDTAFVIELLNQKSFIDHIADKGVRNEEDAIDYLNTGPIASYREFGFGLSCVELKDSNVSIGICGLLKRPELTYPDIGYALLDQYAKKGYATEAATGVLEVADNQLKLTKVCAVASADNRESTGLLLKLGFHFEKEIELHGEPTNYYLREIS